MKLTARSLENAAVHYLRRFPSSAENLRRVLRRKARRAASYGEHDEEELAGLIEATVARMTAAGLLDDNAYARGVADSMHRRGRSLRAIKARLLEKGVDGELVDRALAALSGGADVDVAAAWTLAAKKRLGPFRRDREERRARRQRDLAALARAGFSYDVARRVVEADGPPGMDGAGVVGDLPSER